MRQFIPMNAQEHQALAHTVIAAWAGTSAMGDAGARNPVGLRTGDGNSQPELYAQPSILERFNGQAVVERYVRGTNASYYDLVQSRWVGYTYYSVSIEGQRLPFFAQAHHSLKSSVNQSLFLRTEGNTCLPRWLSRSGWRLDAESAICPCALGASSYRKRRKSRYGEAAVYPSSWDDGIGPVHV